MHKKNKELYKKSGGLRGSFDGLVFITVFSCGQGGICRGHVEIDFGKNSKAKHVHLHYIKENSIPLVHYIKENSIPLCRACPQPKSSEIPPRRAGSLLI